MSATRTDASGSGARSRRALFVGGLAVALALAFFASRVASGDPDGLSRVAIDEGFADTETSHDLEGSPVAGYDVKGVDDPGLSTGLAGVIGVTVTLVAALGFFVFVRALRRRGGRAAPTEPAAPAASRGSP